VDAAASAGGGSQRTPAAEESGPGPSGTAWAGEEVSRHSEQRRRSRSGETGRRDGEGTGSAAAAAAGRPGVGPGGAGQRGDAAIEHRATREWRA